MQRADRARGTGHRSQPVRGEGWLRRRMSVQRVRDSKPLPCRQERTLVRRSDKSLGPRQSASLCGPAGRLSSLWTVHPGLPRRRHSLGGLSSRYAEHALQLARTPRPHASNWSRERAPAQPPRPQGHDATKVRPLIGAAAPRVWGQQQPAVESVAKCIAGPSLLR